MEIITFKHIIKSFTFIQDSLSLPDRLGYI